MAYTIAWTHAAVSDLRAVAAFISQDNPRAAAELVKRMLSRLDHAASFPFAQRSVPEFDDRQTREVLLNPYRVVYVVNETARTITILRVWHAARGTPDLEVS